MNLTMFVNTFGYEDYEYRTYSNIYFAFCRWSNFSLYYFNKALRMMWNMKKLLYFLCILLFTSTVFASDLDVQEGVKENAMITESMNMKYISIDNLGNIAYIISEDEIKCIHY